MRERGETMDNVESINRLVIELETDEELSFMKENSGVSAEDTSKIIESLTRRANLFNNSGIFIPYEEWKEIFLQVAEVVTYTNYSEDGAEIEKPENLIPSTVNETILNLTSVEIPEDIFNELEDEKSTGMHR